MSKDSPFDLFEGSGKKPQKKPKSAAKVPATAKKKKKSTKWRSRDSSAQNSLMVELETAVIPDAELEDLYQRVKKGIKKIDAAVDKVCLDEGVARSEFENHMLDPENFSPEEWADMEEGTRIFKQYLGIKDRKEKVATSSGPKTNRKRKKKGKDLKGKSIGGRRGWTPM